MNGENEKEEEKKGIIENEGIMNLKDLTEEDIRELKSISNEGILIVPKNLLGKILGITENEGIVIPYTEGAKSYIGVTVLDAGTLENFEKPVSILQVGKLSLENDVTPDLIQKKIESIINFGKIEVPANIYGALMAKITENAGVIEKIE